MNRTEFPDEICIANIGGTPRFVRLAVGVVMAAAAGAVAGVMITSGAPRLLRLLVAPLLWLSAVGFLQYRGRT
jgi:hypothetical protein